MVADTPKSLLTLMDEVDAEAMRRQRIYLRMLAVSLVAGVAAGFVALLAYPWQILACVLALMALLANLITTRRGFGMRWRRSRMTHELLVSERWRFVSRAAPYANVDVDQASMDFLLRTCAINGGRTVEAVDGQLKTERADNPDVRLERYLQERIDGQCAFFEIRAEAFRRRARRMRTLVSGIYVAVVAVAVAEVSGFLEVHALGPTIAVVTSLQVWSSTRQWGRTAQVYLSYAIRLKERRDHTSKVLDRDVTVSSNDVAEITDSVELLLADETMRWLALNSFELFDQLYSSTPAGQVQESPGSRRREEGQ